MRTMMFKFIFMSPTLYFCWLFSFCDKEATGWWTWTMQASIRRLEVSKRQSWAMKAFMHLKAELIWKWLIMLCVFQYWQERQFLMCHQHIQNFLKCQTFMIMSMHFSFFCLSSPCYKEPINALEIKNTRFSLWHTPRIQKTFVRYRHIWIKTFQQDTKFLICWWYMSLTFPTKKLVNFVGPMNVFFLHSLEHESKMCTYWGHICQ